MLNFLHGGCKVCMLTNWLGFHEINPETKMAETGLSICVDKIDASIQQAALISLAAMLRRITLALLKRARQRILHVQHASCLIYVHFRHFCVLLALLISSFLIRDRPMIHLHKWGHRKLSSRLAYPESACDNKNQCLTYTWQTQARNNASIV